MQETVRLCSGSDTVLPYVGLLGVPLVVVENRQAQVQSFGKQEEEEEPQEQA